MGESREGLGHVDRFLQVRFHTFYNLGIEEVFLWKFDLYMTPVSIFVNKLLVIRLRLGSMTMDIGAGTVLTVTTAPHSSRSILRVRRWDVAGAHNLFGGRSFHKAGAPWGHSGAGVERVGMDWTLSGEERYLVWDVMCVLLCVHVRECGSMYMCMCRCV